MIWRTQLRPDDASPELESARGALKQLLAMDAVLRNMALGRIGDAIGGELRSARMEYAAITLLEGRDSAASLMSIERKRLDTWMKFDDIWSAIYLFLTKLEKD